MTDTELLDFLQQTGADTGKRDGMHCCLVWGDLHGVWAVVASGHALTLRQAIEASAIRWERYRSERSGRKEEAA